MKLFLLLTTLLFGIAFSQSKADSLEIENINNYAEAIDKDSKIVEYQFEVKNKNKTVKYRYGKEGNDIIEITREWKQNNGQFIDTYTDYFLLKNEERVYAQQSIIYKNKSDNELMGGWSCTFWFHKNKVIHTTSLGHGKTEDDSWDYEKEMRENFNYMFKKVREKDKTIKRNKQTRN